MLSTIEIYIDGKISAGSNFLNTSIHLAEKVIKNEVNFQNKKDILSTLLEAFIDENACLRYRIIERFYVVLQKLFEQHKQNISNYAETLIVSKTEECLDAYFEAKENKGYPNFQVAVKQFDIDISDFSEEEKTVLEKCLSRVNFSQSASFNNRSLTHYKKRKPIK